MIIKCQGMFIPEHNAWLTKYETGIVRITGDALFLKITFRLLHSRSTACESIEVGASPTHQ